MGTAELFLLAAAQAAAGPFEAERYERTVVYHSPQTPGYTSWVGSTVMPGGEVVIGFTQATGPLDPNARARAPQQWTDMLGVTGLIAQNANYDFWGLDLKAICRRSSDGGATWTTLRSDAYHAVYPAAYHGHTTFALPDGSLLRRVNGWDLIHDPSVPHTAYLQRLAPGATAWGAPQVLLNPSAYTYQLSRIRRLRDGRLIATGQVWTTPAGTPHAEMTKAPVEYLLMVSGDDGATWVKNPLAVPTGSYLAPNEWDTAELPNGDLLAVFRTRQSSTSSTPVRRQGLLRRQGAGWTLAEVKDAPFPHSGHPELLVIREGAVLHVATTGIHWTADRGANWSLLAFPTTYRSPYYPSSFQAQDGTIYVFGHPGADDPYGKSDQSVLMDRFSIAGAAAVPGPLPASGASGRTGDNPNGDGCGMTGFEVLLVLCLLAVRRGI